MASVLKSDFVYKKYNLGLFIGIQRSAYKGKGGFKITDERIKLLEATRGWSWDPREDLWQRTYQALVQYNDDFGDVLVPYGYVNKDEIALGVWVEHQRTWKRQGKLEKHREALLLKFDTWEWDPREANWQKNYQLMIKVADETGKAYVKDSEVIDGLNIGSWCGVQRRESPKAKERAKKDRVYRNSDEYKERLRKDALLDELPGWSWDPQNEDWDAKIAIVIQWATDNPDKPIPHDLVLHETTYSRWATKQRYKYGDTKHPRRAKLEKIPGWSWNPKDADFIKKIALLEAYRKKHGDYKVPRNYKVGKFNLGEYAKDLRRVILHNPKNKPITLNAFRLKYLKRFIKEIKAA